jgi:hypothetical protein
MPGCRLALVWFLLLPTLLRAQEPDFGREVLPILSDKCFHCHGPDAKARKAGLRLDTKEGAFREKDGVKVIVPGKSGESELVRRIASHDEAEMMPPPEANRTLSPQQKDILKRWIDAGAKWNQHWAFVAPRRPAMPAVKHKDWVKQPLDHFVLSHLEVQGISPSSETTRESWLRRVSFDLTGLPPTLAELDDFLKDTSATAFEKVVDRLLASPRYGERMASDWLDLARFSDTHGYQMDRYRPMWPYRDWVIKAFNQNLPYDQFVTWQVAGDLLRSATKEQRLATAFNRLHLQNEEGGIVEEEYRVSYVVDRINTFGTAFLGLTLDCTRCHDHKYDPLTMKDYYSLFSFFQNIDESGQTTYFTNAMPVPTLLLSDDATDRKLAELRKKIGEKEQALTQLAERYRLGATYGSPASANPAADFESWLRNKPKHLELPGLQGHYSFNDLEKNQSPNLVEGGKPATAQEGPKLVPGKLGQGVLLDGENGFEFPSTGHFTRSDPFTLSLWLNTPSHDPRFVVLHHSKAPIDAGSRGYELLLEQGKVAFGLHHMWPGNALKVIARTPIKVAEWTHMAVTYDGSGRAVGVRLYVSGKAVEIDVVRDGLYKDITYEGGEPNLTLGHRFRDNGFKGGQVDDLRVYSRALTPFEIGSLVDAKHAEAVWTKAYAQLTPGDRSQLADVFLHRFHAPYKTLLHELHTLRKEESKTVNPVPEAMVMQELPQPKPCFVLKRGAYDSPGEPVAANTPGVLPPFPADLPHNRLGLARWLVQPTHPLTARVAVNRLWQQMFGVGLVETTENFGTQGARPANPGLLDWLALELATPSDPKATPWDMKRLVKMIALSATYRQSSRVDAERMRRDSENKLVSRYPVRRLSAEMLRDQALALSGLLVERQGGPSVKPYQPDGLWEVAMGNPKYDRGKGPDLYRRSLYTFWKRTIPPPTMTTFDAAERNVCLVRRQTTTTPLQALALLNDVQIVEAAKVLGQRILLQPGDLRTRIAWAFRHVTGRTASDQELAVLEALWTEQQELFKKDPAAAKKLLATGEAKVDAALPPADSAAATVLVLALLNHDEAVMRR